MKHFLFFILFVFSTVGYFSQVQVELDIKTADYVTGKKLIGVTVEILEGSTSIKTSVTPSNGNVKFTLPSGKKYKVEFSKAGKVSRYLMVDTKGIQAELLQGNTKGANMQVEVSLFDQLQNVDYSFVENNPITEFYFDGSNPTLVYDDEMSGKMKKKIDSLLAEAEKKDSQNDALYQKAIESADAWYKEKKFDLALSKYEEAAMLKPKEQYPKDRIKELDALVKSQKQANLATQQKDDQYKALIATADGLRDQKKYNEAIVKYNEASKVKDEQYPKDQVEKITEIIENAKNAAANEAKFKALITSADQFYNQKSYVQAKDKYEEALKLKPTDDYTKKRIADLNLKLKDQLAAEDKKKKYDFYISEGQELMDAKKYVQAKEMYNQAIALDNLQQLPKDKLKEIDLRIIEDAKNTEAALKYSSTMKAGDDFFAANKLNEAKLKYQEASVLDPTQSLPKENIKKIEQLLLSQAESAKTKAKITSLLKEANGLYSKNDLENAKKTFQEVVKLDATNIEANTKIEEINLKINQLQTQAQQEEKFKNLKAKGIEFFKAQNYSESKLSFTEAKTIKTDAEIDKYLKDIETKIVEDQVFQKLMQEAANLESTNLDGAILKYKEALAKKPTSEPAKLKISELEKIKAGQVELDKKYIASLKKANDAFNSKKYLDAIKLYEETLLIKPNEKEPKDKILECKKLDEAIIKEKILALIKEGNTLFTKNELEKAKLSFLEVLKIDSSNGEAKAKIGEIDAKISLLQAQAQLDEKFKTLKIKGIEFFKVDNLVESKKVFLEAKELKTDVDVEKYLKDIDLKNAEEELFQKLMAEALALETNNLDGAILKYKEALSKKPSSEQAKIKISDLEKIKTAQIELDKKYQAALKKANDVFASKKYPEAIKLYEETALIKPNEKEPKDKIAECKRLEEENLKIKIATLIKDGNTLFAKNELEKAKLSFLEVLKIDATNNEANAKIQEINTKINQLQSQAQLDEKFKALKIKGIDLLKTEKLLEAKQTFLEAKSIKADPEVEKYIKDIETKLSEEQEFQKLMLEASNLENSNIDASISKYKEALSKRPTNEQVKTKISELEKIKSSKAEQEQIDKKYQEVMKRANETFAAKKYLDAIKLYNEALSIKPNEKEPVDKAAEAQRLEEANKSEVDKQYQKILEVGQKGIDEKNWEKAKEMYNRALSLRKDDVVPKNKLKEIEALIKAENDALINAAEKEKAYNLKMSEAEQLVLKKEIDKAILSFQQAQSIKPDETLPQKRIQELTDIKNKELNASKQEALYNEHISKGDAFFTAKNYQSALTEYQGALGVKSGDKIALSKINEVQQIIDNEANLQAFQKTKAEFDALVKEGDELYKTKNWKDARTKYEAALNLISDNKYAKDQVDSCIKNIKNKPDEDIQYQKIITKADDFFGKTKYDKAKELYERALSLKSSDPYPQQKLNEIEAILHPVIVKQAEPLNILGEPTTEDPGKVHEALVKAELERKNKKNTKLRNKAKNISNNSTETTENKNNQILGTSTSISDIEKKKQIRDTKADDNRQNTIDEVKESETKINTTHSESSTQKYNENLNNKEFVNNVAVESSKLSSETIVVYEENSKGVKSVSQEVQNNDYNTKKVNYEINIKSQGELAQTQIKVDEKVIDDFESRKIVETSVNSTSKNISVNNDDNISKESNNILEISEKIEDQNKKKSIKSIEDAKISGNNDEELKNIELKKDKNETENTEKEVEKSLNADDIVNQNQKKLYGIASEQDENRFQNVDAIQNGEKSINETVRSEFEVSHAKKLEHQDELAKNKLKQDLISDIEKANSDKKFDAVDKIDKKSANNLVENHQSDDEQRLATNTGVSTIEKENSLKNTEKSKKVEENSSSMKNVTDEVTNNKNKSSLEKENQLKNAQGLLDKISSKQLKYDDKVANQLGTLYPEGVSQEVFNQNDENGLLKAVVTRRIVVKSGFGQIYIRTQTLTGTTYSKNGNPSSEFIWQKETQDAKLTKNY